MAHAMKSFTPSPVLQRKQENWEAGMTSHCRRFDDETKTNAQNEERLKPIHSQNGKFVTSYIQALPDQQNGKFVT